MKTKQIVLLVSIGIILLVIGYILGHKTIDVPVSTEETATTTEMVNKDTEHIKGSTTVTSANNYAKLNQKVIINGVSITPNEVSYDGRCAVDVKCIQAGIIDVGVLLESGTFSQSLIMTSGKPVGFNGKQVTLISALPGRVSNKTIAKSDYKFLFVVKTR